MDKTNFDESIKEILLYTAHLAELEKSFVAAASPIELNKLKIFWYKTLIINQYGLLETTIEQWIKDYVEEKFELVGRDFSKLPKKIKDQHTDKTIQFLKDVIDKKQYGWEDVNKDLLIKNLSDCLNNPNASTLNLEVLASRQGNWSSKKIVDAFTELDCPIANEKIPHRQAIDNLLLMRNEISHSYQVSEILSIEILEANTKEIQLFCHSIFSSIEQPILRQKTEDLFYKIGSIKEIKNGKGNIHTIVVADLENTNLNIGDPIIVQKQADKDKNYLEFRILSFGIKGTNFPSIEITAKQEVAIKISDKKEETITENSLFFLPNSART